MPSPSTSYAAFLAQRRFRVLDGLRAIAILLVFTAHISPTASWTWTRGRNGVTVFFVLSGFLITTLALREEARQGAVDLRSFFVRRIFRIYPLYTAVLVLYCVLLLGVGLQPERRAAFVHELPFYALGFPEHGFVLHPGAPFDGAWSLGIEEKFYLLWPILAFWLLAAVSRRTIWRATICIVVLAVAVSAPRLVYPNGAFLASYAHIALGCLVGLALHEPSVHRVARWLAHPVIRWTTIGLACCGLAWTDDVLAPGYVLISLAIALALAALVRAPSESRAAILGSRPLAWLGAISYAFYLTHNFALNEAEKIVRPGHGLLASLPAASIGFVLALLIAAVAHTLLERPMIAIGRSLNWRRNTAAIEPHRSPPQDTT